MLILLVFAKQYATVSYPPQCDPRGAFFYVMETKFPNYIKTAGILCMTPALVTNFQQVHNAYEK